MSKTQKDVRIMGKDGYKNYKKTHPGTKLTYQQYYDIIIDYTENIVNECLSTGRPYKIPFGIGPLYIVKYKPRQKQKETSVGLMPRKSIDWPTTKKMWELYPEWKEQTPKKVIYHLNSHSDGYSTRWCWNYESSYILARKSWKLDSSRYAARKLAEYVKSEDFPYIDLFRDTTTF